MLGRTLIVLLIACVGLPPEPAHAAPQPLTPELMWSLKRVAEPTLSADGMHVVVTVTRYDIEGNKS